MKTALFFPGQGSQALGMIDELLAHSDTVKATFAEASEALGYDMAELVSTDSDEKLNQTEFTQPALLTTSVAIYRVWREQNPDVDCIMAGHSLGEYSALVCAGVLSLSDAVKLVSKRGQFMQSAVPAGTGAMAAIIGLADDAIQAACVEASEGEVVAPVNFNSPGQVVIAGKKEAVERAMTLCKDKGAKRALPLPVSVPSHCDLMAPAAAQLAAEMANMTFNVPECDVINNVDVAIVRDGADIKDALVRQLYSPVRWTETVQKVSGLGITKALEIGPGKVITGLVKRIDKSVSCLAVNTLETLEQAKQ